MVIAVTKKVVRCLCAVFVRRFKHKTQTQRPRNSEHARHLGAQSANCVADIERADSIRAMAASISDSKCSPPR
jgi:hypothetical protein